MRDIKFRAWSPTAKTMYTKVMVGNISDPNSEDYTANAILKDGEWVNSDEHDNIEWMQYTGPKDPNGVEVYEGDVVESFVHPDIPLHHVIEWSDKYKGWFARNVNAKSEHDGSIQLFVYLRNCEFNVIGNIYENPELLEIKDA